MGLSKIRLADKAPKESLFATAFAEQMRIEIDPSLKRDYEGLMVHEITIEGLKVRRETPELDGFKKEVASKVRETYDVESLKDVETIRKYRDFFWRLGIDPTKIRPASEALIRRILQGKDLPKINTAVDAYNLVSIDTHVAIGAFDDGLLKGQLIMRYANEGEEFMGIGMKEPKILGGQEIVISDEEHLAAIYPYRDADLTKITDKTETIYILSCGVPGIEMETLREASLMTKEYFERFCR
jgi:DNA/RNA-binding domain of Phe-tRNA-synthetase-like protein